MSGVAGPSPPPPPLPMCTPLAPLALGGVMSLTKQKYTLGSASPAAAAAEGRAKAATRASARVRIDRFEAGYFSDVEMTGDGNGAKKMFRIHNARSQATRIPECAAWADTISLGR